MSIAAIGRGAWPAEAVDMLARMARAGHSDVEITARLGVSAFVIGRKRRALGVVAGVPARLRIVLARRALPNGGPALALGRAGCEADAIKMLQEFATPASVAERMAGRDCFVAVDGDKVVGTISLGGDRLRQMFVAPEYQRHGLGRRLVEHLEAHARSLGVKELRLHSSLTARAFYARLGYEAVEYQPHDVLSA